MSHTETRERAGRLRVGLLAVSIVLAGGLATQACGSTEPLVGSAAGVDAGTGTDAGGGGSSSTGGCAVGQCSDAHQATMPRLRGVSLASAAFGAGNLPGVYGADYIYPPSDDIDHFVGLGMNVFRLPFLWERLQPTLYAELQSDELARIDEFVSHATGKGAYVAIDPHNYARYYGNVIGTDAVPAKAYSDFWSKLASHFKDNDHVIFAIMNEPHDMTTEMWLADANAALAAIRATGAKNLVLVPGNNWTGAGTWTDGYYGTPNSTVMLGIADPLDNFAVEVHLYFDANSSGVDMANCVSSTIGSERLAAFTGWLTDHHLRAFLGEFGAGSSSTCLAATADMLSYIESSPDQWIGWAYWAAGPWWGSSIGNIEPQNGVDAPQTSVLEKYLH